MEGYGLLSLKGAWPWLMLPSTVVLYACDNVGWFGRETNPDPLTHSFSTFVRHAVYNKNSTIVMEYLGFSTS
jgi:hypothetical protein